MATISHPAVPSSWDQPVRPLVGVAVFGLSLLAVLGVVLLVGLALIFLVLA
jgi:hypothetical protein